jgi:hypothetical protein
MQQAPENEENPPLTVELREEKEGKGRQKKRLVGSMVRKRHGAGDEK